MLNFVIFDDFLVTIIIIIMSYIYLLPSSTKWRVLVRWMTSWSPGRLLGPLGWLSTSQSASTQGCSITFCKSPPIVLVLMITMCDKLEGWMTLDDLGKHRVVSPSTSFQRCPYHPYILHSPHRQDHQDHHHDLPIIEITIFYSYDVRMVMNKAALSDR